MHQFNFDAIATGSPSERAAVFDRVIEEGLPQALTPHFITAVEGALSAAPDPTRIRDAGLAIKHAINACLIALPPEAREHADVDDEFAALIRFVDLEFAELQY